MAEKVKKKLSTRQKTMIVMAAVLIVAVIAVAVALIVVSGLNVSHKETDGFVYSLSGGQATVLEYTGEEEKVVIPAELDGRPVVGIAEKAFYKNGEITSITIKSDADNFTIGAQAFYDMDMLVSVTLPDGVKTIPEHAFSGCDSLTEVTMGNGVEEIGAYAFSECPALANIYISKSSGGSGADDTNYNSRVNMTMPSSLKTIGEYAFYDSINASSVSNRKIILSAALTEIGNNAFYGCNKIAYVDYADEEATVSLTEIGNNAFYGCTSLRFSRYASSGASGNVFFLTKALNDRVLASIGDGAFDGCTNASTSTSARAILNFYEDTEYIGDYAFRGVGNIKEVRFNECDPELGEGAFYGTTNLTKVHYVTKDDKGEYTVESKETSLSPERTSIPALLFYKSGISGFVIGKNITELGEGAFSALTKPGAVSIYGSAEDEDGNMIGEHFALYKLAPYYTRKNTTGENISTTYTEENQHYLLTSPDFSVIYAYIGAFSDNASAKKNDKVSSGEAGQFKFLQNLTDVPMTTLSAYAFAEAQFSQIFLPDKIEKFGANMFNGKTVSEVGDFAIFFENTLESYYSSLMSSGDLNKEFLSGMTSENDADVPVYVRLNTLSKELQDQLNSYFTFTHYEVSKG